MRDDSTLSLTNLQTRALAAAVLSSVNEVPLMIDNITLCEKSWHSQAGHNPEFIGIAATIEGDAGTLTSFYKINDFCQLVKTWACKEFNIDKIKVDCQVTQGGCLREDDGHDKFKEIQISEASNDVLIAIMSKLAPFLPSNPRGDSKIKFVLGF